MALPQAELHLLPPPPDVPLQPAANEDNDGNDAQEYPQSLTQEHKNWLKPFVEEYQALTTKKKTTLKADWLTNKNEEFNAQFPTSLIGNSEVMTKAVR